MSRKTRTTLASTAVKFADRDEDARIERLKVNATGEIVIRFSWWKGTRFQRFPLDLNERHLMALFTQAIREGVLFPGGGSIHETDDGTL